MKVLITALKAFGYVWLFLAGLVILVGIVGVWMNKGFSAVQDLFSPFNIANWLVTALTLAPGIGAVALADKLSGKNYSA